MADDKAEYLKRVVPYSREGWVSKTENDAENGC